MGDVMLSTPQQVLRDTLREKINSSSKDLPHSHPRPEGEGESEDKDKDGNGGDDESTTDEDDNDAREVEVRRSALRQRGRESYAKRKESSIVSTNTTPVSTRSTRSSQRIRNGSFMDRLNGIGDGNNGNDDDDGEDVFFNESRNESRPNSEKKPPPRKKRKSGGGDQAYHPSDDGLETEEDEPYLKPDPGSWKRKVSSSQCPGGSSPKLPVAGTPPSRAKRMDSTSTANTVVSRFKEGSMRDRASAVPPQEIIGMLPSSSPARSDDDYGATMYTSTSATEANISSFGGNTMEKPVAMGNSGGSFTFGGLTSLIPFNPFRIVKDIKDSWDRQKRLHEVKERRKKLLRERKIRGLLAYEEFKRMGALQGYSGNAAAVMGAQAGGRDSPGPFGPIRVDYMQDYTMAEQYDHQIGRALGTDESRSASRASTVSTGLKNRRSTMTASPVRVRSMADSFYEGREPYVDEQDQGDSTQPYSVDSAFAGPSENFSRKSTPKPNTPKSGGMLPPTRVPPPPPIPSSSKTTNGGKFEDVKTLVKKKSKVFAATFTGRGEEAASKAKANSKEGPSKHEIKRQERLQKKVSNLEDQLDKARRELEGTINTTDTTHGSIPSVSRISSKKRILPINTTAPKGWESAMSARESILPGDETDEGEKTDVDEEPMAPLSPVMNASFGGSFMAKTAEMTIMESLDEAEHAVVQGNGGSSSGLYSIVLPKRISKSNLGAARRRRVSSGSGAPGSSVGAGLKHQGSLPVIPSRRQAEAVLPVPKSTNGK